jgi:uncharacterized protein YcfJ
MKAQKRLAVLLFALMLGVSLVFAQSVHHRRKTENQWRVGTYAGAALGAIGLATHKDTLTAIGAATAGYSGYRWSKDIKSRHRLERLRRERRFQRERAHRRWLLRHRRHPLHH